MTSLKPAGFFRELEHGDQDGPSLIASLGQGSTAETKAIVQYLLDAPVVAVCPGIVIDVMEPMIKIGPPHLHSDGTWIWPQDLAYYVDRHHVRLPEEFIAHIKLQRKSK